VGSHLSAVSSQVGPLLSAEYNGDRSDQVAVVGKQAQLKLVKTPEGKEVFFSENNGDYLDYEAILPDNHVKDSVTSQLGETRQARLDLLFNLVEAGVPLKVLMEYLEFPNTSDIFERITQEALGDIALEQMKSAATQPASPVDPNAAPQGTPPPGGPPMAGPLPGSVSPA
jgi:hypothetical protein